MSIFFGIWALFGVWMALVHLANASPYYIATRDDPPPNNTSTTVDPAPDRNLTIGPCTWIINRRCPDDENIKIFLFTRRNRNDRQPIHVDQSWEKSNLSQSFFNPAHPVKIIIHGYNADMFLSPLIEMKDEYLERGEYNLFYIDWSLLVPAPCYISAVHNAKHCGVCVGELVRRILESGTDDIHIIGFSLGAHVPNFVALEVRPFVLPRITGLDPAMPLYMTVSKDNKLDASDARFVDVIHTNALIQGKIERCGHVDFYMNGGIIQPGCSRGGSNPFACSHQRAPDYFAESIRSFRGFWGWPCTSYINYLLGLCPQTNNMMVAGEDCVATARGLYLATTNGASPFAIGRWIDMPQDILKLAGAEIAERPTHRMDPLLQRLDEWGKLDGEFNNKFVGPIVGSQWDDIDGNGLVDTLSATTVRYPLQKKSQFSSVFSSAEQTNNHGIYNKEPTISKEQFLAMYNKLFGSDLPVS